MLTKIVLNFISSIVFIILPLKTCTLVDPDPAQYPAPTDSIRILALGDSYTIGQSVPESDRWPLQLADSLKTYGFNILEKSIVAQTGWTTNVFLHAMSQSEFSEQYDLVGLMIGVNNQFRGWSISSYEKEFEELLLSAIALAGDNSDHVFILSIPDYTVTPAGQNYSNDQTSAEIDRFNEVNLKIARKYNIAYFDITPLSRTAYKNSQLIARDNLHFSGKMYTMWVNFILADILEILDYSDPNDISAAF